MNVGGFTGWTSNVAVEIILRPPGNHPETTRRLPVGGVWVVPEFFG